MKLILSKNTGLSIDNIPAQIIMLSSQCTDMSEGVLLVINDNQFDNIKNYLESICLDLCYTPDGPYMYVNKIIPTGNQTNQQTEQREENIPRPQYRPEGMAPPIQEARTTQETFPANVIVREMAEHFQMAAHEPHTYTNLPIERDVEEERGLRIIQSIRSFPITPVPQEEVEIFLAQKMRNNLTSHANLAMESLIELNKLMGKAVILKNKINTITKNFVSNEKIVAIIKQIKILQEEDNLIEKIEINKNNGWVHFTTKNIITDKLADGKIRDIGKMLITINMNILLTESLPPGEDGHIIKIHNLTRQVENEEDAWECGHVILSGSPCFGDGYEPLYMALMNTDLIMAINIIIKFIKNPDIHDSWGKAALYFPEVSQ